MAWRTLDRERTARAASATPRYSWVCRDAGERERFLDMHRRIAPEHRKVLLIIAALLVPTLPWDDPLAVIPLGAAMVAYTLIARFAPRMRRPELAVAGGLVLSQALLAAAIVVNGSQHKAGLAILAWPVLSASGRFPARVMTVGTIYTAAVMIVAGLGFHGSVALHDPVVLTLPLATMLAVTRMNAVLRESDTDHRGAAVLDGLTGMLNRTALATRTAEIEHQSRMSGRPVGVIVGDVDHFKEINDRFGHETGDAVLRHIAYELRGQLRAFDLAYRLGGEEFAIILLGADAATSALLAEQLRAAVAAAPIASVPVTMSFGVAASSAEVPFVWEDVFRRADRALYRAKAEGRDAVCVADGGDEEYPVIVPGQTSAESDPVLPHAA